MIHPEQMQDAVQHENADFLSDGVAVLSCLLLGALKRDRDFTQESVRFGNGKRKYIGGVVFSEELPIEVAQLPVSGDQTAEGVTAGYLRLQALGEGPQTAP
jgi:hypothetical protein